MELVPIIYTALVIFAILALGTIFISYIMYKIREKNAPEDDIEEESLLHPKSDFMKKSAQYGNEPRKHETKSSREGKNRNERERSRKKPKSEKRESKRKADPIKENKRIKVLNQLHPNVNKSNVSSEDEEKIRLTKSNGVSAKKYSEEDSEFFRLDTTRNKKK